MLSAIRVSKVGPLYPKVISCSALWAILQAFLEQYVDQSGSGSSDDAGTDQARQLLEMLKASQV